MKKTICVFVRNDLSLAQQIVQTSHAVLEATRTFVEDDNRYKIVVFASKSESKLKGVLEEGKSNNIQMVQFTEPDMDYQVTAVATEPLDDQQKSVFSRYRLLIPSG